MKVKLTDIKGKWKDVLNRARVTVHKDEIDKEPSDDFKRRILRAEHSPIRSLIYCFKITNLKSWIATHFARHHVRNRKMDKNSKNR